MIPEEKIPDNDLLLDEETEKIFRKIMEERRELWVELSKL